MGMIILSTHGNNLNAAFKRDTTKKTNSDKRLECTHMI